MQKLLTPIEGERTKRVIKGKPDVKPIDISAWKMKPRQLRAAAEFQEQPASPKPGETAK